MTTAPDQPSLSERFRTLGEGREGSVTVREIIDHFGSSAFGASILFFAAPNIFPLPPGTSTFLAAPLILITVQLMLGRESIWLPNILTRRRVEAKHLAYFVSRVAPRIEKFEKLIRPRGLQMTTPFALRLIGLAGLLLSVVLFLPIPLGNLPPGIALSCFAIGMVERDGVAVSLGWAITLVSFAILVVVGQTAMEAVTHLLDAF